MPDPQHKRLGFFTRLLDEAGPAERYRNAAAQIVHAEACGFDSAWVAQHHFDGKEGGLPSPLVFLSHVAAQTRTIRLGTGIITLPLELPVRAAEDAAVLDLMSGGRLELGTGAGGSSAALVALGHQPSERNAIYERHLSAFRAALSGAAIAGDTVLYPTAPGLPDRMWQATFSVGGAARAGAAGDGLMLSRTQPRPADAPEASLADVQRPIIDAYLASLPAGRTPRISASRSLLVADSRDEARRHAETGLRRSAESFKRMGIVLGDGDLDELLAITDTHIGTVDDVVASLGADETLRRATDLTFQVHAVDPPHELILRSLELTAREVAPRLGWVR